VLTLARAPPNTTFTGRCPDVGLLSILSKGLLDKSGVISCAKVTPASIKLLANGLSESSALTLSAHTYRNIQRPQEAEAIEPFARHMILSFTGLKQAAKRGDLMYLCTVKEKGDEEEIPTEMQPVVNKSLDVLGGLLYGLPPKRAVDHEIDLEPGHPSPHRSIYHLSPTELEELSKQIE